MNRFLFSLILSLFSLSLMLATTLTSAQEPIRILKTGRSWVIASVHRKQLKPTLYSTVSVVGDTVLDGRECFKMRQGQLDFVAYEENGRLYRLFEGEEAPYCMLDMTLGVGDVAVKNGGVLVEEVDSIEVNGVVRRRIRFLSDPYAFETGCWVEGIGARNPIWVDDDWERATDGRYDRMEACYEDGVCIFTHEDFDAPPTGIRGVPADKASDGTIYDLSGKAVAVPQKGEIYIKDGAKYLQR